MIKRRDRPDGLPYRVYERRGSRAYSIGYKLPTGVWAFKLQCAITDLPKIAALRAQAIRQAAEIRLGKPAEDTVDALIAAWFRWQEAKPLTSEERRADSTMAENRREAANLSRAFGAMRVDDLIKADAYAYLDACELARDKDGKPRPRAAKGNKEISLMRAILEYGVRLGLIETNPFDGVARLRTRKTQRLVTDAELALAVTVGRAMGGPQHIAALALKTAWLCLRRSVEVRALTRDQITPEGIRWTAAKRQGGHTTQAGLIEWSPELRATVDEALALQRNKLAGSWYIFGNMQGQRYTRGGWKATLARLMKECAAQAARDKVPFEPFSLQDCRPKGVTDKLARGDRDVVDATLHTSARMVMQIYDRRRTKIAKPAG